jgi:hypothetical protein
MNRRTSVAGSAASLVAFVLLPSILNAQEFLPADFNVPRLHETDNFRIRPLIVNDLIKDYDAVMTSRQHLRGVFGPGSRWPADDMSLTDNLADLGWHEVEFRRGSSFAYAVMSPNEELELGCIYLDPSKKRGYDAVAYYWVRTSAYEQGMEPLLGQVLDEWLRDAWPFESVAFPGRDLSWQEWAALSDKQGQRR